MSNSYNIPVTNRFQLLEVEQEIQVSTANGSNDTSGVKQDVLKVEMLDGKLSTKLNTPFPCI